MLNTLYKLSNNIDYFAECASEVDIKDYKNVIRSMYSNDGNEEGVYFCAIPKTHCDSFEMALSILFINSIYEFQEWNKDKEPFDNFNKSEWKGYLKGFWIPEYFACDDTLSIQYKQVNSVECFPIADKLLNLAISLPALLIIRYGMLEAWNSLDYLIETETEYIDFQSWTTA